VLDATGRLPAESACESVSAVMRYAGPALGALPPTPPSGACGDNARLVSPSSSSAAPEQPAQPLPSPPPPLAARLEASAGPLPRRDAPAFHAGASVAQVANYRLDC